MTALQELLEKVEGGFSIYDMAVNAMEAFPTGAIIRHFNDAHNGSLDAAKALHEAVLPGWGWCVDTDGAITERGDPDKGSYEVFAPTNAKPARAWLIAILKALIAEQQETE